MTAIANCLVTATPNTSGFPTLSGKTNSNGVLSLAFINTITYTLTFTGTAIGKVSSFSPAKTTFTFYNLKNKGTKAITVSGQSLPGGSTVFAAKQSLSVAPKSLPFISWLPNSLFVSYKVSKTKLKMPASSKSISYKSKAPVASKLIVTAGFNDTAVGSAYIISANSWKSIPGKTGAAPGGAPIPPKLYRVNSRSTSSYSKHTNTWTVLHSRANGGTGVQTSAFGGKVYALGGSGTEKLADVFDPTGNSWTKLTSMPSSHTTIGEGGASQSKVFAIGAGSPVDAFDIPASTWASKANHTAGNIAAWGAGGGHLWTNSGFSIATHMASYNVSLNSWTNYGTDPRGSHFRNNDRGNTLKGTSFFIAGGDLSTNTSEDLELFDTASKTFSAKANAHVSTGRGAAGII